MTYDNWKFNADVMTGIIKANLVPGGNARIIYDACEPEVQCLIRCQLELAEKQALGLVADEEALHRLAREREARRFKEIYGTVTRLKVARAKRLYNTVKAA